MFTTFKLILYTLSLWAVTDVHLTYNLWFQGISLSCLFSSSLRQNLYNFFSEWFTRARLYEQQYGFSQQSFWTIKVWLSCFLHTVAGDFFDAVKSNLTELTTKRISSIQRFLHMRTCQNSMCSLIEAFLHVLWAWACSMVWTDSSSSR